MAEYYAPSKTMDYMSCPKLMDLKTRWQEKPTAWAPNTLLGKAIAKGLEAYYKDDSTPFIVALRELERGFVEQEQWTLGGLTKLVSNGLQSGIASGLPLGGTILTVEEDMGGFRPDLVYRSTGGEIVVVDHKITLALKPDWVGQRLAEYESNWQFAHYAWGVGQRYGELVSKVGTHLIVLTPRPKAYLHFVEFSLEHLENWYRQAEHWYHRMDQSKELNSYPGNWNYCQRYGSEHRCAYYRLCHDLAGDELRAGLFYDRIYTINTETGTYK